MDSLAALIAAHRNEISGRWSTKVAERLGLEHYRKPQLINEMPEVLSDLVEALNAPPEDWRLTSGRHHARQRIELGMDIGGLAEEFGLIGETILELAAENPIDVQAREASVMLRFLGKCTSESVTEFARLSSLALQQKSAENFSFVAHELRTPLQAAKLALTLVRANAPESPGLDRLHGSLQRLSTLIDNSLVDARLTAEPTLRKEQTAAAAIVDDVINHSTDLASQRNIRIESEVEDFDFEADHRLMVSALTNLVVNGIKFSREGSLVLIKGTLVDERVHFEVQDSCGGLPEGGAARMFQQFAQVGSDRSGFGLGLLIVKQAIEAHGGRVRVADVPGDGCRMLLELPRRQSRLSEAASKSGSGDH